MSDATKTAELDLQAIIKKAESQTNFPEVPLDEFTPPTYEEWKQACVELLKGAPFEKKMFTYFRAATEEIQPKTFPGMGDYIRGAKVNGYVKNAWGIAQACDETMPEENNELLKHEIDKGSTIYNVKLDCATKRNVDARNCDHPGKGGVSLTTLEDVEKLLNGLKLDKYPLYVYAGQSSLPVMALIVAAVKKNGGDVSKLKGVVGANPIAELVANGELSQSLDKLFDEAATAAKWSIKNAPELKTFFVNSDVFSNGGANDIQELAYTLSAAVAYLRALLDRGLTIDEAAKQIMFGFSAGANFFMQVAKFRAVRPIWAEIIKAFGGNEESQKIHVHARPALFFKTVYDPYVNMLRNTSEIFSAVVGGVESFENAPFDEPIRKGDEFSRRIARNVQIILQEEFGLLQPIDPAGGSWAVENLTKQVKEKVWAEFQNIEGKGGIVEALKSGYVQDEIEKVLEARLKALATRKDRIVGSNMYPNMTEERLDPRPENFAENKNVRKQAIDSYLANVNAKDALGKVDANNFDTVIDAAAAGATIAELRDVLGKGDSDKVKVISAKLQKNSRLRKMTMLKFSWRTWDRFRNIKPAQISAQDFCRSARLKFLQTTALKLLMTRHRRRKSPAQMQL